MKKIYKKADEEHVAAFIVYGKAAETEGADNELFEDSAFSKYLDAEEVHRAYLNNCLVIRSETDGVSGEMRPILFQIEDSVPCYISVIPNGSVTWKIAVNPGA